MNRLSFSDWLIENIQEWRKSRKINWDGQTLILEEVDDNVCMKVRIEKVSRDLAVFNFDQGVDVNSQLKRSQEFIQRCDFMALEETALEYIVYLIELKAKVPSKKGAAQLRWSAPFLEYILAVFLSDSLLEDPEKKLKIKHFQIGDDYVSWVKRMYMKRQNQQRFEWWYDFKGPDFLYCTYQGHRLEFSDFKQE